MHKSIRRIGLAVLCGALAVSSAQAHGRGGYQSYNNGASHGLIGANVNVGGQSHNQAGGSLLGVNANVLSNNGRGQANGSLLGVTANVLGGNGRGSAGLVNVNANLGGLLGVKANVGAGETRCDFCGGNDGGVGRGGW